MKELGFDHTADLEKKLKTVMVMDVWESSEWRKEEEDRKQAEAPSSNLPKNMGKQEHLQSKYAAESKKYQTLHDRLCPSSGLRDKVLGMIEENHLELIALDEMISLEDGEDHRPGATVEHGTIRITSSRRNIPESINSEGLRRRLRIWNLASVMAKLRHLTVLGCKALRQMWLLLGEDYLNLDATDVDGMCVALPSFKQVLLYYKHFRKAHAACINGGLDFLAVLKKQ